jgi:pSer/pThr/pTyr-binding forkhead associated (FHA) protein
MSAPLHGELIPLGGGDNIPLIREVMTVGRRESCDIPLRFPNISGKHAELTFRSGYWYIRDLHSTNGIKVNDLRVDQKLLHPGDKISIGKRLYTIQYSLPANQSKLEETETEDFMSQSLLERAGLQRRELKRKTGGTVDFDPGDFLLNGE